MSNDPIYRKKVYQALKSELGDSFSKSEDEFYQALDGEEGYKSKVYQALKGTLGESFNKSEDEFLKLTTNEVKKKEASQSTEVPQKSVSPTTAAKPNTSSATDVAPEPAKSVDGLKENPIQVPYVDGKSSPKSEIFLKNESKRVTEAFKDIPWVARALNPESPKVELEDGSIASHKLAAEQGPDGKWYVFPTIDLDEETGQFYDLRPEEGKFPEQAFEYAKQKGTLISFDDPDVALHYAENGLIDHTKKEEKQEPKNTDSGWVNHIRQWATGGTDLGAMAASIPETLYSIAAIPQNALAAATGWDIEATPEKFGKATGLSNPVLELYEKERAKLEKETAAYNEANFDGKTDILDKFKEGKIAEAFELIGNGLARSAPTTIAMMAGGAAVGSAGKLAAYSTPAFAGEHINDLGEENPDMSHFEKTILGLGAGASESVYSAITTKAYVNVYKDIIKKEGAKKGGEIVKQGIMSAYETAVKKFGIPAAMVGEGLEESATQISQNLIHGRDPMMGVTDAAILGMAGGGIYGAPVHIAEIKSSFLDGRARHAIKKTLKKSPYVDLTDMYSGPQLENIDATQLKTSSGPRNANILEADLKAKVKKGDMTQDEANTVMENFNEVAKLSEMTSGIGLNENQRVEAAGIIKKKLALQEEIKGKDKDLVVAQKEQIKELSEQLKNVFNLEESSPNNSQRYNDLSRKKAKLLEAQKKGEDVKYSLEEVDRLLNIEAMTMKYPSIGNETITRGEHTATVGEEIHYDRQAILDVMAKAENSEDTQFYQERLDLLENDPVAFYEGEIENAEFYLKELKDDPEVNPELINFYENSLDGYKQMAGHFKNYQEQKTKQEQDKTKQDEGEQTSTGETVSTEPQGPANTEPQGTDKSGNGNVSEPIVNEKSQVKEVFEETPELSEIGTEEQYEAYLETIFPDSKVKGVQYHGDKTEGRQKFAHKNGIYFTPSKAYAIVFAEGNTKRLVRALVNAVKPHRSKKAIFEGEVEDRGDASVVIGKERVGDKTSDVDSVIVYDPSLIHILGSKQDIKGFKDYVTAQKAAEHLKNNARLKPTPLKVVKGIIEQLKGLTKGDKSLAQDVQLMSAVEMDAKLKALGMPKGLRMQIIGPRGAAKLDYLENQNRRMELLDEAIEMDKGNVDARIIKTKTGWEKHTDGLWRMEIDGNFEYVETKITNLINNIKNNPKVVEALTKNEAVSIPLSKVLPPLSSHVFNVEGWKLVIQNDSKSNALGSMHERSKTVEINLGALDKDGNLYPPSKHAETIIHEVQHIIQEMEGFPSGSSTTEIQGHIDFTLDKLQFNVARLSDMRDRLIDSGTASRETLKSIDKLILHYQTKQVELSRHYEHVANQLEGDELSYVLYKLTGGEMEARNASLRARMTPAERKSTMLYETEDAFGNSSKDVSIFTSNAENSYLDAPQFQKDGFSKIPNGFVYQGRVYLNQEQMGMDTPIHEFGHLWNAWAKVNAKKVYKHGIDLIESQGDEYINFVKENQPELTGEALYEEALAQAIGDKGAKFVEAQKKKGFKQWLDQLWAAVKDAMGISDYSLDQIQSMDLGTFAEAVSIDLLKGGDITGKDKGAFTEESSNALKDAVKKARGSQAVRNDLSNIHRGKDRGKERQAAWESALETVAEQLEKGKTIKQAIAAGIKAFGETAYHEAIERGKKTKAKDIVEAELQKIFKPFENAKRRAIREGVQKTVRKNTGQTDTSKKITLSASKLNAKLLTAEAVGARKAYFHAKKQQLDVKALKERVKELVAKAKITPYQAKRLINKAMSFDKMNPKQVEAFFEDLARTFAKGDLRAALQQLEKDKKAAKKKAGSAYGVNGAAVIKLANLHTSNVPSSLLPMYADTMARLAKVDAQNLDFDMIDNLFENLEAAYKEQVELEYQERQEEKAETDKQKENAEVREEVFRETREGFTPDMDRLPSYEQRIVRAFKAIPVDWIAENMPKHLSKITMAMDAASNGWMHNKMLHDVVQKHEAEIMSKSIEESAGKLKPSRNLLSDLRNLFKKANKFNTKDFTSVLEGVMVQHVDTVIKGLKGASIYKTFFHPISANFNKAADETSTVGVNFGKLINAAKASRKGGRLKRLIPSIGKAFGIGKGSYENDIQVLMQLYLRQKEYDDNIELRDVNVWTAKDYVEATRATEGTHKYTGEDIDRIEQLFAEFSGKDGQLDMAKLEAHFNAEEKAILDFMREELAKSEQRNREVNDHRKGKTLNYPNSYFPRRGVKVDSQVDEHSVGNNLSGVLGSGSTTQSASNKRTAKAVMGLDFGTFGIFMKHVQESNIEYNLSDKVKVVGIALTNLKGSDNRSVRMLASAMEQGVNKILAAELSSSIYTNTDAITKAFKTFTRNTYTRMLTDFPVRLPVDVIANWAPFYVTHVDRIPAMAKATKKYDKKFLEQLFKEHASVHSTSRLGGTRSVEHKESETSALSQAKYNHHNPSKRGKLLDFYSKNLASDFGNNAGKLYYKIADKPARHLWALKFEDNFKKLTGKTLDTQKYLNDAQYREDNYKAIQQAITHADKTTSDFFNTASKTEQKIGIQATRKDFWTRVNSFMRSFTYNENRAFWDSLRSLVGGGTMPWGDAARLFITINVRSIAYSTGIGVGVNVLLQAMFPDFDEDEEMWARSFKRAVAQHGLLLLGGNKGLLFNVGTALALEYTNKWFHEDSVEEALYGDSADKYDRDDELFFTVPQRGHVSSYATMFGAEGYAVKTLIESAILGEAIASKIAEGEEITEEELVEWKAYQISIGLLSQVAGIPINKLGVMLQRQSENEMKKQKALYDQLKKKK